jgi:SAM-dependent methyltransferase
MTDEDMARRRVRTISRYSELARSALQGASITDCEPDAFAGGQFGGAAYSDRDDAPPSAVQASLGCGNPVAIADLKPGERVLDLGSGGGLDVLLSARRVGPAGMAYGLDGSADMVALAHVNATKAGISNVRFIVGHIEEIPLPAGHVDVVISNCVINLSGDKPKVLAEAFRVLRPGGRLGISDVIAEAGLDPQVQAEAEHRVGCACRTLTRAEYERLLAAAGFTSVSITVTAAAGGGLHSAIVRAAKPGTV